MSLESIFIVLFLITLIYIDLLLLWLILTKIKVRDRKKRLEAIKNPKSIQLTALERIEKRNRIIENRRLLKR